MPHRIQKVLAQAGTSLADVYDVEGSVAGIEELDSESVKTVHEMGSVIMSERLSGTMVVITTIALAQTLTWDVAVALPPRFNTRILGVQVFSNQSITRSATAQVSISNQADDGDLPIWAWNSGAGSDDSRSIRARLFAGTLGTFVQLTPGDAQLTPSLLVGTEQPIDTAVLRFRGLTATFGAGTVVHEAVVYNAFPALRGVSSRGLPMPSW